MELPKGQGWYTKRDVVYLAIRVQREKFTFATQWRVGDSSLTLRKLDDFKKEKIAEAAKQLGVSKMQRNVTVSALFKAYIIYLRKNEKEKGEYVTAERTNSDRVEPQIKLHLDPFFGKMVPKDVAENLERYRLLRVKDASPSTINGEFRILRAALRRGWKNNRVHLEHLPKEYPFNYSGERESARTGNYTDDQIQSILEHATPQFLPIFSTLIYTGLRPKEARWIKRDNVLMADDPRIVIVNHKAKFKTGKTKVVAIIDDLLPVLEQWEEQTKRDYPDCEWFFHVNGERYDADALDTEWNRVQKACKIPAGTVLYDARRTHSVLLDKHGVSKEDRKTQMGHTTDAMSDLYNEPSIAHVPRIRTAWPGSKPKAESTQPAASQTQPAAFDWKAELKELKAAREEGLLPEDLYREEVQRVMQSRR